MTDANKSQARTDRLPRWRRALVATLVILSVVLLPIAGLTVWVRNLVLDTDKYVDRSGTVGLKRGPTSFDLSPSPRT